MRNHRPGRRVLAICVAVLLAAPRLLWGDDASETDRIYALSKRANDAENWYEYGRLALQLMPPMERSQRGKSLQIYRDYIGASVRLAAKHLNDAGQHAQAESLLKAYPPLLAQYRREKSSERIRALGALADHHWNQQQYDLAAPLYEKVLALRDVTLPANDPAIDQALDDIAQTYYKLRRYRDAIPIYLRRLKFVEAKSPRDEEAINRRVHSVGDTYWNAGQRSVALSYYQRAYESRVKTLGPTHQSTLFSRTEIAITYYQLHRYDDAIREYTEILRLTEQAPGAGGASLAVIWHSIGDCYWNRQQYDKSLQAYQNALQIRRKVLGNDHLDTATSLHELASVYRVQDRFAEAEKLLREALAIREAGLDENDLRIAKTLAKLATIYTDQARYAEAEQLVERAVKIAQTSDAKPAQVEYFNQLGAVYSYQGRLDEAEASYRKSLAILGDTRESLELAATLLSLADLYADQGHAAEAEALFRRSLAMYEKLRPAGHEDIASAQYALGKFLRGESRPDEAEELYKKSLKTIEPIYGPNSPRVADRINSLAILHCDQGRFDLAEPLYKRAIEIWRKSYGDDYSNIALTYQNLSLHCRFVGRREEAERYGRDALAMYERLYGPEHPALIFPLANLAALYELLDRPDEVEPLLDRAVALGERAGVAPAYRYDCYFARAKFAWKAGRRNEAISDLRRAMDLADQQRTRSSGAEHERAAYFGRFSEAFERMVAWQTEAGDLTEALQAIERTRARSLMDELKMAGSDLQVGLPAAERQRLRQRQLELSAKVTAIEEQLSALEKSPSPDAKEQREALEAQLVHAREELYRHYLEQRTSSPVYRNLLTSGADLPRLNQLERLVQPDGMLMIYLAGAEGGYVLVIGNGPSRLVSLELSAEAASALGVEPGPLTASLLQTILIGEDGSGIARQLSDPIKANQLGAKLAALWQALIPESDRETLTAGKIKRLYIVPDGPLSLLPFETLVVATPDDPKYLLDVGPPILYAPSTSILRSLLARRTAPVEAGRAPVLTVGDPAYNATKGDSPAPANAITSRAVHRQLGGHLNRLPYSGQEASWVAEVFQKQGSTVTMLRDAAATEANVRTSASGRRIVHLACHGLTDQRFGNFYGALALAPGVDGATDPADDGFLTLSEIYELNLRSCELAILSACETNFGPEQRGEGVWALSRGFLVAGARRVVASNWLVDDQAGASLISYFCAALAKSNLDQPELDHARALQTAKRWVRQQEKWESPYYWATFVLVGPQ